MSPAVSDQVGRVLGGRYRLIAPVGSGGSGQVYLADDTELNRRVAVKMLHPTLADDETFLKRFRTEAQAAAALSHPNIMQVYDWGRDDVPFLVSEYLGGGTLRATLDAGHLLTPSQALLVGLDAVRGLEYAHRRGLVHRDIKPGNLLFDDERRLKIADFGLARALAEAGWTEPEGTVVGTARYASPEQAQGRSLTGKSDVYALALVLVESVTGTVPFSADTTLGTLMARVDNPLPVPDELGPLRSSLERAGAVDPDDRPDAGEFGVALMAAAEELPRPTPIPTVDTLAGSGTADGRDLTMVAPSPDDGAEVVASTAPSGLVPEGPGAPPPVLDADDAPPRRGLWAVVFAALLVALAVGGWFAYQAGTSGSSEVPDLVGVEQAEAEATVRSNGWEPLLKNDRSDDVAEGQVIRTAPAAGETLDEGDTIEMWVSLGATLVALPAPEEVAGLTPAELEQQLVALGFTPGSRTDVPDEDITAGLVVALDTDQTELPKGSEVGFLVSVGPAPRVLPDDLGGLSCAEATARLEADRLRAVCRSEFNNDVPEGQVIRLQPRAGSEVDVDRRITIWISDGPEPVAVPSVIGSSVDGAEATLADAGFAVCDVDGPPNGTVTGQDPIAGETAQPGACVDLTSR